MVALLADEQQHAAVLLGLRLQQIDRVAYGVENRRAAIARVQVLELLGQLLLRVCEGMQQVRLAVEANQCGLAVGVGEKHLQQRTKLGHLVELKRAHASLLHRNHQRNGRGVHLLLHANLLRYAVIF